MCGEKYEAYTSVLNPVSSVNIIPIAATRKCPLGRTKNRMPTRNGADKHSSVLCLLATITRYESMLWNKHNSTHRQLLYAFILLPIQIN